MNRALLIALTVATVVHAKSMKELTTTGTPEEKGLAIAQELAARNAGYRDLGGQVDMVLSDASGSEARRSFSLKVLEKASGTDGDKSLIVFDAPADVKGTAVLSHASPEGEDEQWLFLPSAHRTKRISAANRTGAFAGSEFSFEDLTGNDARKYGWKYVASEGNIVTVEATPRDAASAYSKRLLHIDATEMRISSIDFFDRRGEKLKTLTYSDYKQLNEKFWRSHTWSMKNLQTSKATTIRFTTMKLGTGLSVADFAPGKLGN